MNKKTIIFLFSIALNAYANDSIKLPELPSVPEAPKIDSVEIIELKDIGSVESNKLGEIPSPAAKSNDLKPVELKKPEELSKEPQKTEVAPAAVPVESNKQTVSDKFKLPAHLDGLKQNNSVPFPTDNLVDIPPIHSRKSDSLNINKKAKNKKSNNSSSEIARGASDEINTKNIEDSFYLDYSSSPNKLIEYNNTNSENTHLPKLISKKDYQNATFLAIDNGDIETFVEYAKKLGSYEFTDNEGNTLLIYASMYEQENIVKWLLNNKANINAVNMYGASSLHAAVLNNNVKIAKLLLSHNIDKLIMDQNSKAAIDYVISSDMKNIIEGKSNAKKDSKIMKYKKSDNAKKNSGNKKIKVKNPSSVPSLH